MTADPFEKLLYEIARCRICADQPRGAPLPHAPRPVLRGSASARIAICGQAPGTRVHASGKPFTDPSGVRLRAWLGLDEATFYDVDQIAIIPMGFCFPGHDRHGGDRPPRRECAPVWRDQVFDCLPRVRLVLAIGQYAQWWHMAVPRGQSMTETVRGWRSCIDAQMQADASVRVVPLPHPSWRNNAWLKKNPWFEGELLPWLRAEIGELLDAG